jgi:3-ketosteroid 9alpha-monooxygenase subunit A
MLCENDGPIYQLRKWYSQFYMDAADVPREFAEATLIETVRKCDPPAPHHVFED